MNRTIRSLLGSCAVASLLAAVPSFATGATTTAGPLISGHQARDVSCDIFSLGAGSVEAELYRDDAVHRTLAPTAITPGEVISLVSGYPGMDKAWTCKVWGDVEVAVTLSTIGLDQGSIEAVAGQKPGAGVPDLRCEYGQGVIGIAGGAAECACLDTGDPAPDYYDDKDQDGYSNSAAPALTSCTPPAQVSQYTTNPQEGLDCNEFRFDVNPGQTQGSATAAAVLPTGGYSWDYNCDGVDEIVDDGGGAPSAEEQTLTELPGCNLNQTAEDCQAQPTGGLGTFSEVTCGATWGYGSCAWRRVGSLLSRRYACVTENPVTHSVQCR